MQASCCFTHSRETHLNAVIKQFIFLFGQVLSVYVSLIDLTNSVGIDFSPSEYPNDEFIC